MVADLMRLLAFLGIAVATPGWCQVGADPTRPPAAREASDAPDGGAPVLESVLIPRQGKPVAWISGQRVELGQHFGDAKLVRLTEGEAVLRGSQGELRLRLTPAVTKQFITNKTEKTPGGATQ